MLTFHLYLSENKGFMEQVILMMLATGVVAVILGII